MAVKVCAASGEKYFLKRSEIGRKTRRVKKIDPPHNECIKETHCCDKIERDFPFSLPPLLDFIKSNFLQSLLPCNKIFVL